MQDDEPKKPGQPKENETPSAAVFFGPGSASATPAATPASTPSSMASSQPPAKKSKKPLLIGGIVLAALVVAGLIFLGINLLVGRDAYADLPYEYTAPQLNIDPAHRFEFKINYDLKEIESAKANPYDYSSAFSVYNEPTLTYPALEAQVTLSLSGDKVYISPNIDPLVFYFSGDGLSLPLDTGDIWDLNEDYYLVQKLDRDGKPLEKPKVTHFTPKKEFSAPSITSAQVDELGNVNLAWQPVEDATAYYIVSYANSTDGASLSRLNLVGLTTDTTWSSHSEERDPYDLFQNFHLHDFDQTTEDDLYDDRLDSTEVGTRLWQYGVIAVNDTELSGYVPIDGANLNAQAPYMVSQNAMIEMFGYSNIGVSSFDDIPTAVPVTMLDGRTVLKVLLLEPDDNPSVSGNGLFLTYRMQGTSLRDRIRIKQYDANTYKAEAARITTRNIEAGSKNGLTAKAIYKSELTDFAMAKKQASTTRPSVPYPVNGSNELTKYIAANMIAGNKYIDVSGQLNANGPVPVRVEDAMDEAMAQNPYILGLKVSATFHSKHNLIEVYYGAESKQEDRKKLQQDIFNDVKRIVGDIIKPGMNDREKVRAINDYITGHASYDYAAYEHGQDAAYAMFISDEYSYAWDPSGVLLRQLGVCLSYAEAFKVLADQAGLRAVVVYGISGEQQELEANVLNSEGAHAWNKVLIDGAWRVIDVTWNDSVTSPNRYFALTDAEANKTRRQDNRWMSDSFIAAYAAR